VHGEHLVIGVGLHEVALRVNSSNRMSMAKKPPIKKKVVTEIR